MAKTIITNDGFTSKVTDNEGNEIKGVVSVNIEAAVGELTKINAVLWTGEVEAEGKLSLYITHPITGHVLQVKSIAFEDGVTWEAKP